MLHDITPVIRTDLGVWPGDTPAGREVLLDLERGDSVTLSTLRATVHLGAHADAPSHYLRGGETIETRPLDRYLGPCQVIHVPTPRGRRVTSAQAPPALLAPRVLLRTDSFPDPYAWNRDFAGIEPELINRLASAGVTLVGIDTPSVDLMDSKDLPAHARCAAHDLAILEGLVLAAVPDGVYELIALPLPLAGFDASPVRAVLRGL